MTDLSPAQNFRLAVERQATDILTSLVGPEQVQRAAGRLAMALRAAATANPRIYECDRGSVAEAVAKSALTDLMPGGVKPLVYLIPRKGRLDWQVSIRGLQALAERNGWVSITATPVHVDDDYEVILGSDETIIHRPARGRWARVLEDLQGMYVKGKHRDGLTVCVDVPMGAIQHRKGKSQSGAVWSEWPVEMAQKTAVGWAISRGYFGGLESTSGFEALSVVESQSYREAPPARQSEPPAAIEHHVDAEAFEAVLDAAEEVAP